MSLLSHLQSASDLDDSADSRALVKREAMLLNVLLGPLTEDSDIFDGMAAAAFGRQWSVGHARILACWAAGCGHGGWNTDGMDLYGFVV